MELGKEEIKELLLSEPFDIVDGNEIHFQLSEELELFIQVDVIPNAESDEDGVYDNSTYKMDYFNISLHNGIVTLCNLPYTVDEVEKIELSEKVLENIKEQYLNN